jgi:hypothetical protein
VVFCSDPICPDSVAPPVVPALLVSLPGFATPVAPAFPPVSFELAPVTAQAGAERIMPVTIAAVRIDLATSVPPNWFFVPRPWSGHSVNEMASVSFVVLFSLARYGAGMPDDTPLAPTIHAELVTALAYRLRFDERGKAHRLAAEINAQIAAETLARYLDQAGFVIMKRPLSKAHSTSGIG